MGAYASILLRVVVGAIYLFQAYLALFAATPKGLAAYIDKLGLQAHTILAVAVITVNGSRGGAAGRRAVDAPRGSLERGGLAPRPPDRLRSPGQHSSKARSPTRRSDGPAPATSTSRCSRPPPW